MNPSCLRADMAPPGSPPPASLRRHNRLLGPGLRLLFAPSPPTPRAGRTGECTGGGLRLVEIPRVWSRFGLPFWRKTEWTPAGEKFHASCAPGTETVVAGSGGEPRWLRRGLGCAPRESEVLSVELGAPPPQPSCRAAPVICPEILPTAGPGCLSCRLDSVHSGRHG
ncbi:hypothetical protein NN561_017863 [Cricetulus griseus]